MKLSWQDGVTTALALFGGTLVYAKYYEYNWAVIGSWRSAGMVLAGTGLLMFLFSRFNVNDDSWLNIGEMLLSVFGLALAVSTIFVTTSWVFYTLAAVIGTTWLVDTLRKAYQSLGESGSTHHPSPVH